LVLSVVNLGESQATASIRVDGFIPASATARCEAIAAPYDARNTFDDTLHVHPSLTEWQHGLATGSASYTFEPRSVTTIRLR
jgi:alpha-L-arabinofuranosidase